MPLVRQILKTMFPKKKLKIPTEPLEKAAKKANDAVIAWKTHLEEPKVKAFSESKFWPEYERGILKKGSLPKLEDLKTKLDAADKNNKGFKDAHLIAKLKEAVKLVNDLGEAGFKEFNKKLAAVLETGEAWSKAAADVDAGVAAAVKALKADDDKKSNTKLLAHADFVLKPVTQREGLAKVQKSLNDLESGKDAASKEASDLNDKTSGGDDDDDDDKDKKGSNMGIIIGVVAAALAVGGIVYCKCNNKCCFAEKEEMEGGSTDRSLFKKEVKSKNSHKRHTKESLVPSFKVAEEEA